MSNIERTDKNVGSIEEDIKRCKKLTEVQNANWIGISNQLAIAHLIERIKELEEENVTLRKANNITKDLTKEVKMEYITQVMNKSYEEFMSQFISKQKVKDKIEELKKEYEIALEENSTKAFILKCKISALEELLEEE